MRGDHLTWVLFWLGVVVSIVVNLGTGMLLAVTFFTLQLRRDLQATLDQISRLAHQTFDAITMSRIGGELKTDAGKKEYEQLSNAWVSARRTLHFALSKTQYTKLVTAIDTLRQLREMYVGQATDKYWRRYEIHRKNERGEEITQPTDYQGWAIHYRKVEELAEFLEFAQRRDDAERQIDYLLFYDPEKFETTNDPDEALPLPTELERTWDFQYLFPLAWKWFAAEIFSRPLQTYRSVKRG
jgi:hypothetical protein